MSSKKQDNIQKGHQDPKPEHGNDHKPKENEHPRIPTKPGVSHSLVR